MIYLHKILPFFVLPLGLMVILVLSGVVFRRRYLCVAGIVLVWLAAMPATGNLLMRAVEGWEVRLPAEKMPEADAIVVLSGARTLAPGDPPVSEWGDADRFFGGLELYRAGKARFLIFTGGWVPWRPLEEPEGRVLMRYAVDFGVPPDRILTTEKVNNTAQEASAVADMLGSREDVGRPPRVLLVTSAFHMRRSQMLFERAGLEVTPFRVDFQVSEGRKMTVLDFLPTGGSLRQTERALREIYGFCYYRLKRNE